MEQDEWLGKVGASWAAEWRRTDRSFGALTDELLKRTRPFRSGGVLDVGCGAGELTLAIARGHRAVEVRGLDISPSLITAARERAGHLGNANFLLGDAAVWRPDDAFAPDLVVSRHGVMFFEDPPAAFANLAALSARGARLLFSCFRAPVANPVFTEVACLLPEPPPPAPPGTPGPFAFSDPDRVRNILERGGWKDIEIEPFNLAMVVGAGVDPVEDALSYFSAIGPAASASAELEPTARAEFREAVRDLARQHLNGGLVTFKASTWIVTARKA